MDFRNEVLRRHPHNYPKSNIDTPYSTPKLICGIEPKDNALHVQLIMTLYKDSTSANPGQEIDVIQFVYAAVLVKSVVEITGEERFAILQRGTKAVTKKMNATLKSEYPKIPRLKPYSPQQITEAWDFFFQLWRMQQEKLAKDN